MVDGEVCGRCYKVRACSIRPTPALAKDLVVLLVVAIAMDRTAKVSAWIDSGVARPQSGTLIAPAQPVG